MPGNTNLTPDIITKRAIAVLHDKLTFIGSINRAYDSSFADSGAKIGSTMRIRKPAQLVAGEGATATSQAKDDQQVTLDVEKQFHVLCDFTSKELTMDIDSFSENFIDPAMATLASKAEEYAIGKAIADIGGASIGTGSSNILTWRDAMLAGAYLDQKCAPRDNNRHFLVDPIVQPNILDETKGLNQDASGIAAQYRDGLIGRTGGFNWAMNSRAGVITNPSDVVGTVTSNYVAGATTISLSGLAESTAYPAGTAFTSAVCNDVHPETKADLGRSHIFIAKEAFTTDGSGVGVVTITPVYATTGRQNVTALPLASAAVALIGSASTSYRQCLAYHRDFFTFATADLELPPVSMKSRQVMDNISIRFAEQWDAESDKIFKRFDIACGGITIRPEHGWKLWEPNT